MELRVAIEKLTEKRTAAPLYFRDQEQRLADLKEKKTTLMKENFISVPHI
jgi:hypothetical protein